MWLINQAQYDPPTSLSRTRLRTWSPVSTNSGSKMARQIGARLHRGCLHAIRKVQKWGLLRMYEVTPTCRMKKTHGLAIVTACDMALLFLLYAPIFGLSRQC